MMTAPLSPNTAPAQDFSSANVSQQYGVLPWREGRHGDLRILLITERNKPDWRVPRGWPIRGRVPFMSAALDAFEEAGIIGDIDPQPLTNYLHSGLDTKGAGFSCRVTLFAMRVRGTLLHWKEKNERQRRWFGVEEAASRLKNAELAGFLRNLGQHQPLALTQANGHLPSLTG